MGRSGSNLVGRCPRPAPTDYLHPRFFSTSLTSPPPMWVGTVFSPSARDRPSFRHCRNWSSGSTRGPIRLKFGGALPQTRPYRLPSPQIFLDLSHLTAANVGRHRFQPKCPRQADFSTTFSRSRDTIVYCTVLLPPPSVSASQRLEHSECQRFVPSRLLHTLGQKTLDFDEGLLGSSGGGSQEAGGQAQECRCRCRSIIGLLVLLSSQGKPEEDGGEGGCCCCFSPSSPFFSWLLLLLLLPPPLT